MQAKHRNMPEDPEQRCRVFRLIAERRHAGRIIIDARRIHHLQYELLFESAVSTCGAFHFQAALRQIV